jgi:ankyrin repeat protein
MGPLVGCCAGLVEIDTQNVVRLTHPTVQEYLDKCSNTLFPEADIDIARTCLTYLCFEAFSENPRVSGEELKARLQLFPFLDYAVPGWSHHLRGQPEKELKELILSLLNNDSNFSNFKQVWNPRYLPQFSSGMTGLHIAANFGLASIVSSLLTSEGVDVDSKDDKYGRAPLSWAADNGYEAVVKLLLEKGADVESKSNNGRTPLSWAAKNGHEAVVKLLLEKGADVGSQSIYGQTPLSWAAENGYEAVVKLLLEKGADVESRDTIYDRTPLSWAAENGHEAVVKLLLEKEADVDSKDEYGQAPLWWAARNGHEAIVKLLLEEGADVESVAYRPSFDRDSQARTPLSLAAKNGHKAVVKLLLEKGADVESRDTIYDRTPLSWAAENGLEEGADAESKDDSYTACDEHRLLSLGGSVFAAGLIFCT